MRFASLIFLGTCICAPVLASSDPCAFLPKDQSEFAAAGFVTVEVAQCRALTDPLLNGGKPLTLLQLEEVRSKLLEGHRSESLWGALEVSSINKKVDCMIVAGDIAMCHCLTERLPVRVSFLDYLRVVTSAPGLSADQFGLNQTEFSKLSGALWSVRDQCSTAP